MSYVHFIAGTGKEDKILAIALGVCNNPEIVMASWADYMPFGLRLLGLQRGTLEDLEKLLKQFRSLHMYGPWYKPTKELQDYIAGLEPVDLRVRTTRVSLDLTPPEKTMVEQLTEVMGTGTNAALIRKALRFYNLLVEHKERGYLIQAVKGGSLVQFPHLDVPYSLLIKEPKAKKKATKK